MDHFEAKELYEEHYVALMRERGIQQPNQSSTK